MSNNLEYCFKCDEPTGCAGRADDSHYNEDGEGPFCWRCWCEDENPGLHEQIDQLTDIQSQLTEARSVAFTWQKTAQDRREQLSAAEEREKRLREALEEVTKYNAASDIKRIVEQALKEKP